MKSESVIVLVIAIIVLLTAFLPFLKGTGDVVATGSSDLQEKPEPLYFFSIILLLGLSVLLVFWYYSGLVKKYG